MPGVAGNKQQAYQGPGVVHGRPGERQSLSLRAACRSAAAAPADGKHTVAPLWNNVMQ